MNKFLLIISVFFWVASPAMAQDDEDGGGFLTRTIEGALSGEGRDVNIVGFSGALSSEATFDRMTIADKTGIWMTLENVSLNWRRAALLRGRLEVNNLTAQSLVIARLPDPVETQAEIPAAEAEEFKFELPELPVTINLANFEVATIDLSEPILGIPVQLTLKASAQFNDDGLFVDLLADRIDAVKGELTAKAKVLRDGAEIDVNLGLDEAEGGIAARMLKLPDLPSMNLSIAGVGQLDDFTADIDLATAGQPRMSGQVVLSAEASGVEGVGPNRRIRADIGGDVTALFAPEYEEFFGSDIGLTVNTVLEAQGAIDVETFALKAKAVDLKGAVRLNEDLWPSFVDVKGKVAQDGSDIVLPGSDAGLSVTSVTLDVSYDKQKGDAFKGQFDIAGAKHETASIDQIALKVDGTLVGDVSSIGSFDADVSLNASGVDIEDENTARAMGDSVVGSASVKFVEDAPIEISNLKLSGAVLDVDGNVVIAGLSDGFPTDLEVDVTVSDLSRFAGLAQRPLEGAAALSVKGSIVPLSKMFDLVISGNAQDVVVDIPQADGLLKGRTDLSLAAKRDVTGTFVRDLILKNDALDVSGNVVLRSNDSDVELFAKLSDIALIEPKYQGAVVVDAKAQQTAEGWRIDTDIDAPYDGLVTVKGLATGPDADLLFDVSMPEIQPLIPSAQGPLLVKGRLWQSQEGYKIDVEGSGPFGGEMEVDGLATGPDARVNVDARLPDLAVLFPRFNGALSIAGEVARSDENWSVDTTMNGPAGMNADIAGTTASDGSSVDMKIVGQVPLGLAGPFIAPRSISGPATFDLNVKGPPSLEAVSGSIVTSDMAISAPNARFRLRETATKIDIKQNVASIDLDGAIEAGGRLKVNGTMNLATLVADIALSLRQAVLIDPNLYEATINSADINLKGPVTGNAQIAGDINISEVNVTVPDTGVTAIGAIPEIEHVGSPAAATVTRARAGLIPVETDVSEETNPISYGLDVAINAPSQIFVRGRGLNAELGGDLKIKGQTNDVISSGSLELIRGRFDIIGRRFDLDEGSIQFQGALVPFIKFVTTTQTTDGSASISVEGLATEPEITFSAVPEAPEDEILSLIIFGRYVSELSAFQALELANGVALLTGRGGVGFIGNLREGIGLDELDVTTDPEGGTSVTAGRYITDTIYTDVTTNAEKGTDISLNIDLNDNLTGRATVAQDGDGGIGVFFERDY